MFQLVSYWLTLTKGIEMKIMVTLVSEESEVLENFEVDLGEHKEFPQGAKHDFMDRLNNAFNILILREECRK